MSKATVADTVFYIQNGKVKLTVLSTEEKNPSLPFGWPGEENSTRNGFEKRHFTRAPRPTRTLVTRAMVGQGALPAVQ
jgi:hypothetical protein